MLRRKVCNVSVGRVGAVIPRLVVASMKVAPNRA